MQTFGKLLVFVVALAVIGYFVQQRLEHNKQVQAHNEQVARENANIAKEEAAEAQADSPRGKMDALAAQCKGRITEFVQQGKLVTVTLQSENRDAFRCFLVEGGVNGLVSHLDKTYEKPFQEKKDAQGRPLFSQAYRFETQ
jgi:hypothetical protein